MLLKHGITFTVGDEYEEQSSTSPMAATYCGNLPRVYCGTEPDNKINIGLKVQIGGGAASVYTQLV